MGYLHPNVETYAYLCLLKVPSLSALQQIHVEKVTVVKNHFPCNCRVIYLLESILGRSEHFLNRYDQV